MAEGAFRFRGGVKGGWGGYLTVAQDVHTPAPVYSTPPGRRNAEGSEVGYATAVSWEDGRQTPKGDLGAMATGRERGSPSARQPPSVAINQTVCDIIAF